MIERGWITEEEDAFIRRKAKEAMAKTIDGLTEPEGNGRRIMTSLWPEPTTRDFGVRSDGRELQGLRCEELETFSGTITPTKFIEVIAGVMARRMQTDSRIVVFGEDIHRLKGGTNGATKGLAEKFPDRIFGDSDFRARLSRPGRRRGVGREFQAGGRTDVRGFCLGRR